VTIGGSVALIIIGAILRFAVTWSPKNVDLQVIGVILIIGGAAGLCVAIAVMIVRRRDRASAEVTEQRRYIEPR
jgi:NADH:ubiquinone oxidoreductase subunit K